VWGSTRPFNGGQSVYKSRPWEWRGPLRSPVQAVVGEKDIEKVDIFGPWFQGLYPQKRAAAIAGIALGPALMPALTMGALSIIVVPGITTTMAVAPILGMLAARDYMQNDRVIARLPNGRRILTVRAKHLGAIELRVQGHDGPASLTLPHDSGWSEVTGTAAIHATGVLIAGSNRFGAAPSRVQDAVQQIEDAGDASGFLIEVSTRNGWRGGKVFSLLNHYRGLGAMNLSPTERLALEMSVHEETERRAMEGELAVLEAAWRDAEIIAAISDDELTPPKLYE